MAQYPKIDSEGVRQARIEGHRRLYGIEEGDRCSACGYKLGSDWCKVCRCTRRANGEEPGEKKA